MSLFPSADSLSRKHTLAADRGTWSPFRDIDWERADPSRESPAALDDLERGALSIQANLRRIAAMACEAGSMADLGYLLALVAAEHVRHLEALRLYLEKAGRAVPALAPPPDAAPEEGEGVGGRLLATMFHTHLSSYLFRGIAGRAQDPILAEVLTLIATDEARDVHAMGEVLEAWIGSVRGSPASAQTIPRPIGDPWIRARSADPGAAPSDATAVRTFRERVERMMGPG